MGRPGFHIRVRRIMPQMLKELHTLICEVDDMDRAVAFYRDVLGLPVPFTSPHWTSVQLGTTRIGLHPPMSGQAVGRGWIVGIAVDDIVGLKAHLTNHGCATGEYHDTPGGVVMNFEDPDGNRLQAIQVGVKAEHVRA
jgi:predicted enzyme related to lactoylglutathione lyase